jgi:putative tryptophan/tyrosine transport system substrate-binding protein
MLRREFLGVMSGAAVTWPLAARAQQNERVRRIGVLMGQAADDQQGQARSTAFVQTLQSLGWVDGRNAQIDVRWGAGNSEEIRRHASELVALRPDVIIASGSATVGPLLQATSAVPIVFVVVPDPVGAGFVDSLARPGGNATGFTIFEYGIGAKWLELLKEISPRIKRVAVLRDAAIAAGVGQFGAIQSAAPTLGVELSPINVRDAGEIERAVAAFARSPDGGLIVTAVPSCRPACEGAPRARAVKAGRRDDVAACASVSRPRLDGSEHGARIKRIGTLLHWS